MASARTPTSAGAIGVAGRAGPEDSPEGNSPEDRPEDTVVLGSIKQLARQQRVVVRVGERELLVIFHGKRFTVVENRCPHSGAALDDARVTRRTLTCAVHSYRYALDGGACVAASQPWGRGGRLTTFPTRVVDGFLYADVDSARRAG